MDDKWLMLFVAVTSGAVLLQAMILVALYYAVRKSTAKMEALATEVQAKVLPTMDTVQTFLTDVRPKLDTLATNVSESSTLVRNQLARIDATLTDTLDRTRLQVIRADELLNRTMDRVEETSDVVHKTVMSPLRQVNGLVAALSTGFEVFLGHKRRSPKNGMGVPHDEMFI
jgi:hypothetical protein